MLEALSGESSQVSELCRKPHNLSEDQLSKWRQQFLENAAAVFAATDKQSSEAVERIAHLEQLVDRLTLALEIQKKHWGNTQAKTLYWINTVSAATHR